MTKKSKLQVFIKIELTDLAYEHYQELEKNLTTYELRDILEKMIELALRDERYSLQCKDLPF
jgi:hypothetical protein